jgi:hypothetical protein
MHYNYNCLQNSLDWYYSIFSELTDLPSNPKWLKNTFIWEYIIAFELMHLPGVDRCAIASGHYFKHYAEQTPLVRSYQFVKDRDYPTTPESTEDSDTDTPSSEDENDQPIDYKPNTMLNFPISTMALTGNASHYLDTQYAGHMIQNIGNWFGNIVAVIPNMRSGLKHLWERKAANVPLLFPANPSHDTKASFKMTCS